MDVVKKGKVWNSRALPSCVFAIKSIFGEIIYFWIQILPILTITFESVVPETFIITTIIARDEVNRFCGSSVNSHWFVV